MAQETHSDTLWPSPSYYQQIEQLKQAIGHSIFLAEIHLSAINAGVKVSDEARVLLAVIDFPRPDPYQQLCPHMLILDDGRGINIGHIARVSIHQAFGPEPDNILFQNEEFTQNMLFAPRELSRASMARTSKRLLSEVFGDKPGKLLESERQAQAAKTKASLAQPNVNPRLKRTK